MFVCRENDTAVLERCSAPIYGIFRLLEGNAKQFFPLAGIVQFQYFGRTSIRPPGKECSRGLAAKPIVRQQHHRAVTRIRDFRRVVGCAVLDWELMPHQHSLDADEVSAYFQRLRILPSRSRSSSCLPSLNVLTMTMPSNRGDSMRFHTLCLKSYFLRYSIWTRPDSSSP